MLTPESIDNLKALGLPTDIPLASDGVYCRKCGNKMIPTIISLYKGDFNEETGKPYYQAQMRAYCPRGDSEYITRIRTDSQCQKWIGFGLPSCFIATAAYGTPYDSRIDVLRWFRDTHLKTTKVGRHIVSIYYKNSPPIADYIKEKETLRLLVRLSLYLPIKVLEMARRKE